MWKRTINALRLFFLQARRRTQAASHGQVLADVTNIFASVMLLVLPIVWAAKKADDLGLTGYEVPLYVAVVLYSLVHRYFLAGRFKPPRLAEEEKRRPMRLAAAISKFTVAVGQPHIDEKTLIAIERSVLDAIKSEVEAKIGDVSGVCLGVNLLIPDPRDNSQVLCLNRTNTDRDYPKTYQKDKMLAWKSMCSGAPEYEPNFKGNGVPYKSILCFPLLYEEGNARRILGAVSIDHSGRNEFDGTVGILEITLSPYLRILELALAHRARLPEFIPARGRRKSRL